MVLCIQDVLEGRIDDFTKALHTSSVEAVLFSRQLLNGSQDFFFSFNNSIFIYFSGAFFPLNISAIGSVQPTFFLKVRQTRNDFFKPTFLPNNERTNSILLLVDLFSFIFWKKVKTQKIHFEINWPLVFPIKPISNFYFLFFIAVTCIQRPMGHYRKKYRILSSCQL